MSQNKTSAIQFRKDDSPKSKFTVPPKQGPKRADKLVFHQSDDDGINQSEEQIEFPLPRSTTLNSRVNMNKLQYGFSKDSAILKPSILRFQQDDLDYIKQDIHKTHQIIIQKETDEQIQGHTKEKTIEKGNAQNIGKRRQFFEQQQSSLVFQNLDIEVKECVQINKSNRLPVSLLYQESQESQNRQNQEENCILQLQYPQRQQQGQKIGNDQMLQGKQLADSISEQFSLCSVDSLLHPNQQTIANSLSFSNYFTKSNRSEYIRQHLINPIKERTRHIFHLYITQNFLAKSFQLWLDCSPENVLLLQANKTIKWQRSQYEISAFIDDINQYFPLCSLVSNIDRNEYNLQIDHGSYTEMAATISAHLNFHSNRSFVIYVPSIDEENGKSQVIIKNQEYSSLRLAYRQKQNPNVTFSSSQQLGNLQQKLFKAFSLRQSKKNAIYRNKGDHISLIFGRKGQNQYTIVSGGGYSPIQILSLAIANIEAL